MTFEFKIKKNSGGGSAKNTPLMDRKGAWDGNTATMDWGGKEESAALTVAEIQALKRKHGTNNVNFKRAELVKDGIVQGKKQTQIIAELSRMGRGYGERMIKADHAALLKPIKKQQKKVQ